MLTEPKVTPGLQLLGSHLPLCSLQAHFHSRQMNSTKNPNSEWDSLAIEPPDGNTAQLTPGFSLETLLGNPVMLCLDLPSSDQ